MGKSHGFTLTDIMLGVMFTGSLLAILFGYALPAYKKHIDNATVYAAIQQFSPYIQAITLCSQVKPAHHCIPGKNNVPPLEESTNYKNFKAIPENNEVTLTMTLAGSYSDQDISYRLDSSSHWSMSCNNKGAIEADLCVTRAIQESPYWNGSSNGTF